MNVWKDTTHDTGWTRRRPKYWLSNNRLRNKYTYLQVTLITIEIRRMERKHSRNTVYIGDNNRRWEVSTRSEVVMNKTESVSYDNVWKISLTWGRQIDA